MQKEYKTKLYNQSIALQLGLASLYLIIIFFIIYVTKLYGFKNLGLGLVFFMLISPIIFSKKFRAAMIRNAILNFNDNDLKIAIYDPKSDALINEFTYAWNELNGYRFYFDSKLNTCLTLYLKDNIKKTFIFNDDKKIDESSFKDSVFNIFCVYVKEHNEKNEMQILPRKYFFLNKNSIKRYRTSE